MTILMLPKSISRPALLFTEVAWERKFSQVFRLNMSPDVIRPAFLSTNFANVRFLFSA